MSKMIQFPLTSEAGLKIWWLDEITFKIMQRWGNIAFLWYYNSIKYNGYMVFCKHVQTKFIIWAAFINNRKATSINIAEILWDWDWVSIIWLNNII